MSATAPSKDHARIVGAGGTWFNIPGESRRWLDYTIDIYRERGISPRVGVLPTPAIKENEEDCGELAGLLDYLDEIRVDKCMASRDTQSHQKYNEVCAVVDCSDIILVMGGNISELMLRWRTTGIDRLMYSVAQNPLKCILGASAGLSCLFAQSQTRELPYPFCLGEEYYLLEGIGAINAVVCPHYWESNPQGEPRSWYFRRQVEQMPDGTLALGVGTYMALDFDPFDQVVRVLGALRYEKLHWMIVRDGKLETRLYGIDSEIPFDEFFCS